MMGVEIMRETLLRYASKRREGFKNVPNEENARDNHASRQGDYEILHQ